MGSAMSGLLSLRALLGAALIGALAMTAPALAAEMTIYSGGAVKSALVDAAAAYEQQKGDKITIEFHPMGPLAKLLAEGSVPDIVILTREVMDEMEKKPVLAGAPQTEVGRVAIGVAVNEKAPSPDISTPEAFKAALLAAKSIVYIDPGPRHQRQAPGRRVRPARHRRRPQRPRRPWAAAATSSSRSAAATSNSASTRSRRSCR